MSILAAPCPLNSKLYPFLSSTTTTTTTLIFADRHRPPPPPSSAVSSLSIASQLYNHHQPPVPTSTATRIAIATATRPRIDKSLLQVSEAQSDAELWAAAFLRVRSFYDLPEESFGIQLRIDMLTWFDGIFSLSSSIRIIKGTWRREFDAKGTCAGTRQGFRRVSCINATLPLSQLASFSDDLCSFCKFSDEGEDRVVVGTLDLNQCIRLPEEITGAKPKGIGADFARAYLSNVCVAKELHRIGLAYALIAKSKLVAEDWGISDLYVHVAIDNEPAKNLYEKSDFIYENEGACLASQVSGSTTKAAVMDRPSYYI